MHPPHMQFLLILSMLGTALLVGITAAAVVLTAGFPVWFYRNHWRYSHPSLISAAIAAFLFFVAVSAAMCGACDAVFYFWSH